LIEPKAESLMNPKPRGIEQFHKCAVADVLRHQGRRASGEDIGRLGEAVVLEIPNGLGLALLEMKIPNTLTWVQVDHLFVAEPAAQCPKRRQDAVHCRRHVTLLHDFVDE